MWAIQHYQELINSFGLLNRLTFQKDALCKWYLIQVVHSQLAPRWNWNRYNFLSHSVWVTLFSYDQIPTGWGAVCPWKIFSDCQNGQGDYFSATQLWCCPAISGLQCCELNVKTIRTDPYLASLCLPESLWWLHITEGNEASGLRCFICTSLFSANRKEQSLVHNGKSAPGKSPAVLSELLF